jgi:tetratricopeptide (TPR) repeat protein
LNTHDAIRSALAAVCVVTGTLRAEIKVNSTADEGDAAFKQGNYDLAISKYTEILKKKPNDSIILNDRATAYQQKKDYAHAIVDFNKALSIKADGFVYYNRAITYQAMRAHDKAISDFTRALKLTPHKPPIETDCLIGRAHSYVEKENADAALADLNEAIKIGTDESDAYVLRGIVHKVRHEYELSVADYEKAIALNPNEARSYDAEAYLLSVCPMPKYRDGKKAVKYAGKACELTKWQGVDSLETLAAAYAESGQFDDAVKFQTKAAEIDPRQADQVRLTLYQQKQPFRDLNRRGKPFANLSNISNKISVNFGHRIVAQFEVNGDLPVAPKVVEGKQEPVNSLSLEFRQDKRGRTLFLTHSFGRMLHARCLARLKDYDAYFETDILPVPPKTINPEIWSDPIEELVLFDFKLSGSRPDEEDSQDVAYRQHRSSTPVKLILLAGTKH